MKILVLASDFPPTANMAGSPRLFSLCRSLAERHQLTLASFNETPGRLEAFEADPTSAGVFKSFTILPGPRETANWWGVQQHRLRQEAYFVTRYRYPRAHREASHALRDVFDKGGFDALYVDGLQNAQYMADSGLSCPAVMDLHDCVTMLYTRKTRMAASVVPKLRLMAETASIRRWERSLSRNFGAILTNSPVDQAFLHQLNPEANTLTIGNGVDSEFFHSTTGPGDPNRLVFTGVMSYGPNEDAALYFCDAIYPLIRESQPNVRFDIVGKRPSNQVLRLGELPGVTVAGEVPDVRPYLEAAGIFVCPLRWGAGIKNKVLAALSMGKAVVATPQSVEGLDLKADVDLLLAANPVEFASKVMDLMANPERARLLGQTGRETVTRKYSWDSSGRLLANTLEKLVAARRSGTNGSISA